MTACEEVAVGRFITPTVTQVKTSRSVDLSEIVLAVLFTQSTTVWTTLGIVRRNHRQMSAKK